MMSSFLVVLSGFVFALGLGISGMTDANKVIAFLNPLGGWDPSLAFVMVGAIGVHLVALRLLSKRQSPLLGGRFVETDSSLVDTRLVMGAGIFGAGWGLGGFCPGPALVSATALGAEALVFTAAMLLGMVFFHLAESKIIKDEGEVGAKVHR